jgi:hypothetical protein
MEPRSREYLGRRCRENLEWVRHVGEAWARGDTNAAETLLQGNVAPDLECFVWASAPLRLRAGSGWRSPLASTAANRTGARYGITDRKKLRSVVTPAESEVCTRTVFALLLCAQVLDPGAIPPHGPTLT